MMKNRIKTLVVVLSMLLAGCSTFGDPYLKLGVGYKFHETELSWTVDCHNKTTGRVELGYEIGKVTYGIEHTSDLTCGHPFSNKVEYTNDQIFIDYKFNL